MNIEFRPSSITLDYGKLISIIRPYIMIAIERVEEKYIDLMGIGIDETSTAPQGWRDGVKADLKHIEEIATNTAIEYVCGLDYAQGTGAWMRAMVIAYGMGELGLTGQTIHVGPRGRYPVWDNDLERQKASDAYREHDLPKTWYHAGGWFLQNATVKMTTLFQDIAEDALSMIPTNAIRACITVVVR